MEVIKAQMQKDAEIPVPPVHAHGVDTQKLLANNNNSVELRKAPRPTSGIRQSGLAAPS